MQISDSLKAFLILSGGIIIANLFVMNDVTTLWNMVESDFLLKVQSLIYLNLSQGQSEILIPFWQSAGWYQMFGFSEFNVRAIGVVILLLSFFGFYYFGKKIFGAKPTLIVLLVAGSCFFPVNLIKFASGDAWLLASHLMSFLFLILFLKQPINKWKWSYWIFVIIGTLVHPLSSLVWNLGIWGYLQVIHPNGKRLGQLWLLPLLGVLYVPLWFFGHINLSLPYFFMGIGSGLEGWFFPIVLFGILPWIGFLPAAFWDMFQKLKKKEEMAIINLGWILFGLFSQSMVVFIGFAFIIGKQVLAYFDKNYPYSRWVKAGALLNIIFACCAFIVALMSGYVQFKALGFRSVMSVGAIYWMMSFAAVLGLFLRSHQLVIGGTAMSGILSTLLFWLMVNPLLEQGRNLPQQIFQNLTIDGNGNLIQLEQNSILSLDAQDSIFHEKNLQVYLNEQQIQIVEKPMFEEQQINNGFVLRNEYYWNTLPENHFLKQKIGIELEGGFDYFEEKKKYNLFYFGK